MLQPILLLLTLLALLLLSHKQKLQINGWQWRRWLPAHSIQLVRWFKLLIGTTLSIPHKPMRYATNISKHAGTYLQTWGNSWQSHSSLLYCEHTVTHQPSNDLIKCNKNLEIIGNCCQKKNIKKSTHMHACCQQNWSYYDKTHRKIIDHSYLPIKQFFWFNNYGTKRSLNLYTDLSYLSVPLCICTLILRGHF